MEFVVDIRSTPQSRTNPQFNLDALPEALAAWQIGHTRIAELGGRRPRSKTFPPEVNGFWSNQSFHNYADHALSDEFRAGFSRLIGLSCERRCAIMCSEALWWRCHRRFVADYLLHHGSSVFHLMGVARVQAAQLNPAARPDGVSLVYPAPEAPAL
ncbi:MAG: repair protein [Hyphomicrobiales bacterium]|nr:repair protein [Hyphomicrobiales bacterium]